MTVRHMNWNCYRHPTWKPSPARLVSTKSFLIFATRVNKVCRGHGSCGKVPMDKDLWIDLEDFAKAFRKEVPPDVFITVSNLFGTAMKIDKHGKSRFQFLCAKIPDFPVRQWLRHGILSRENSCNPGSFRSCPEDRRGSLCQFNHGVLLRQRLPRAKSQPSLACPPICAMTEVPDVAFHRTMRSSWKSIAQNGLIPGGGDSVNGAPCPHLHVGAPHRHRWVSIWIESKMSS